MFCDVWQPNPTNLVWLTQDFHQEWLFVSRVKVKLNGNLFWLIEVILLIYIFILSQTVIFYETNQVGLLPRHNQVVLLRFCFVLVQFTT